MYTEVRRSIRRAGRGVNVGAARRAPKLAGTYNLRKRAERQAETRRRIVAAAVALHTTVGPARTTDAAIAAGAGVTRVTFYRHFPDEASLFRACTAHGLQAWPPPEPDLWLRIGDPAARLEHALRELYAYYRVAGDGLLVIGRDAPLLPPELLSSPSRLDVMRRMSPALLQGWAARGRRRTMLAAALGLAVSVGTWEQLIRREGLSDGEAVQLLVTMVEAAAVVPARTQRP